MTASVARSRTWFNKHSRGSFQTKGPLTPIPENESCDWASVGYCRNRRSFDQTKRGENNLINQERSRYNLPALKKSIFLDSVALVQAQKMAAKRNVFHSAENVQELQTRLQSKCVGENVQCGSSVRAMHDAQSEVLRRNILGNFNEFGLGTARGVDGKIYMCQLFRTI